MLTKNKKWHRIIYSVSFLLFKTIEINFKTVYDIYRGK